MSEILKWFDIRIITIVVILIVIVSAIVVDVKKEE
jgi:hypothetical protein